MRARSEQAAGSLRRAAAALCMFLVLAPVAWSQHIADGNWVGRIIHLTGAHMDVVYQVRNQPGGLQITMEVEGYGPFEFARIHATADSLRFTWEPSFELACSMARLGDRIYQGACMDPWGGFGGILMAPPGTDVDGIELDAPTIESIAGWTEPVSADTLPSLGATYPLGQRVQVHGRETNYVVAGEGPVTVVLEAALGDNLTSWETLHRLLARHTRVFAYDRAGLGYSAPSGAARTPEQIAIELRGVLREAGIAPPYVLVAHGEGALYARRFVSLYRDMVQALVLVDPDFEDQVALWRALDGDVWEHYWRNRRAFQARLPGHYGAEFEAYAEVLDQGRMPGAEMPRDLPVTVLTAARAAEAPRWVGEGAAGRQARIRSHAKRVALWRGAHVVLEESARYIHREYPARVLEAILPLLESRR